MSSIYRGVVEPHPSSIDLIDPSAMTASGELMQAENLEFVLDFGAHLMAMSRFEPVQDLKFQGEKVVAMQFAFFESCKKLPSKGSFHSLWGGHWAKVLDSHPIFLNLSGFGGAFKYVYQERMECHGLQAMISTYCHNKYLPCAILVHTSFPSVVVEHLASVHQRLYQDWMSRATARKR